jgi:hypothetical protein
LDLDRDSLASCLSVGGKRALEPARYADYDFSVRFSFHYHRSGDFFNAAHWLSVNRIGIEASRKPVQRERGFNKDRFHFENSYPIEIGSKDRLAPPLQERPGN